jgi:hypothetical protein
MALRPEEERCALALQRWLSEHGRDSSFMPGADPPDVDFVVENKRWAVEVSGLHKYFPEHSEDTTRLSSIAPLRELAEKLERELPSSPPTLYVLRVDGPLTGTETRQLEAEARGYIRSGRRERQTFDTAGRTGMFVVPLRVPESKLVLSLVLDPIPITGTRETIIADNHARLWYALTRMLARKLPMLAGLRGRDRKILMVHSTEFFATEETMSDALRATDVTEAGVDAVFLLDMQGNVYLVMEQPGLFGSNSVRTP